MSRANDGTSMNPAGLLRRSWVRSRGHLYYTNMSARYILEHFGSHDEPVNFHIASATRKLGGVARYLGSRSECQRRATYAIAMLLWFWTLALL
jgi:hypothetical protein